MKKISLLFSRLLVMTAVLSLSLVSCKQEPKHEDPKEAAEEANEEKFDNTVQEDSLEDDSEYLVGAAETDLKEIELGKLAQAKSTNPDVKAFGKMMVDAHTKGWDTLKELATKKNITLPAALTDKGQDAYKDLNERTGSDFDKAYADKMVEGHEKTIDKIEKASEKAKDPDIRLWAADMLPTLRTHLEHAKALKTKTDALK